LLTKVTVVPPPGAFWPELSIPVHAGSEIPGDTAIAGLFIEKVDGLEPVTADISTNSYNELDGEFPIGSRVGKRNIVLHFVLDPRTGAVSNARDSLYAYFMPKMAVTLQFDFDNRDPVRIDGFVEDLPGDRWSNDPNMQASIVCPKPNFRDVTPVEVDGQSTYDDPPPLTDVPNNGDRVVGMTLRIINDSGVDFDGDIHIERLIESSPGVYYSIHKLYLVGVSLPGDLLNYVWINTNPGEKVAEIRGPDIDDVDVRQQNLLGRMSDDSVWPSFSPAVNKFRVITTGTTGWSGHHLNWILEILQQYGGV
jgi:hypothetical protein